MSKRTSLVRGLVALAVLGALAGAMIVSPVGAAAPLTKAKVKKIATKIATKTANNVFDSKIGPATAPFQAKSDLLFAVVDSAGVNPVLVNGRGVTGLIGFVATIVTFNRNVNNCAATATYEGGPDDTYAEVEYDTDPNELLVWLEDDTGAFVSGAGTSFHLIVICP
jgi:hypothetical protein